MYNHFKNLRKKANLFLEGGTSKLRRLTVAVSGRVAGRQLHPVESDAALDQVVADFSPARQRRRALFWMSRDKLCLTISTSNSPSNPNTSTVVNILSANDSFRSMSG